MFGFKSLHEHWEALELDFGLPTRLLTSRLLLVSGQRSPHNNFFNRLPATPRRLDLSQDVLRTTECAPDRSGDARFIHGRVVKSPAARARRTLFRTKLVEASTSLVRASTILLLVCTILVGTVLVY